jgi:hypothetical protein
VANFVAQQNLTTYRPFRPTGFAGVALGLRKDREILLWLRAGAYTATDAQRAYLDASSQTDWAYSVPMQSLEPLVLAPLVDGVYAVTWFDTRVGEWGATASVTAVDGVGELAIPDFVNDCAVRLVRKEA